jgi:ubiquitin C-terminal hydrolase
MLNGENQYMCEHCNKKCNAKKRFSIEKSPRILTIHLKRFDNNGSKIKDNIRFPKTFSLKYFKSESIDRIVDGLPSLDWADLHKKQLNKSKTSISDV